MSFFLRHMAALLAAACVTGAIASILQTQLVFASLRGLGVPVTFAVRALTTLEDLAMFGPVMSGIAFGAQLPAILAGHLIACATHPAWRAWIFAAASLCGLGVAFWLMRSVIPLPALPGTRGWLGHVLMSSAGTVGGLVYARLGSPARQSAQGAVQKQKWHDALWVAVLIIAPASLFFANAPHADDTSNVVDPASYAIQTVATGLERPWSAAFLPDGRVLVTGMGGRLLAISRDGSSTDITLDGLPPIFQHGGTTGLMEVALDPRFEQNRWLYLTMGHGDASANGVRLVRARLDGDHIADVRVLFTSTLKASPGNNGGRIAFLNDGTLVLSLGDGSAHREAAQDPANTLGTVVRLDREGRPPVDNPFIGQHGVAPAIYSLGHRNPRGIAVDPTTGELLLTEHGPRGGDEINRFVAGATTVGPSSPLASTTRSHACRPTVACRVIRMPCSNGRPRSHRPAWRSIRAPCSRSGVAICWSLP